MSTFKHVKFTKPASAGWLVDIEHLTVVGESANTVDRSVTIQCRAFACGRVFEDMSGQLFLQKQDGDLQLTTLVDVFDDPTADSDGV